MSVSSLIKKQEFIDLLAPFVSLVDSSIKVRILVEPLTKHYALIGTAFDYAMRFELVRNFGLYWPQRIVADEAYTIVESIDGVGVDGITSTLKLESFLKKIEADIDYLDGGLIVCNVGRTITWREARKLLKDQAGSQKQPFSLSIDPDGGLRDQLNKSIYKEYRNCLSSVDEFVLNKSHDKVEYEKLARAVVKLSYLDIVVRSRRLYIDLFEEPNPNDLRDIVSLLKAIPLGDFVHKKQCLLNPSFGRASRRVGGADADLIVDGKLIDVKTTKSNSIKKEYIRQLLCYLFLSRMDNLQLGDMASLSLYFSRHGYLWTIDSSVFTKHPGFREAEKKFWALVDNEWKERRFTVLSATRRSSG